MTSDDHEISLAELDQIIKDLIARGEISKDETMNVRTPIYKDLAETLENVIVKAVIGAIRENKDPEPDVNSIVRQAARTIIQTAWDCVNQDCALMTRRIYKALEDERYWG